MMILWDYYHQIKIIGYGDYSQRFGKEVYFGELNFHQQIEALNQGFAPALPLENPELCSSNYAYPIDWTSSKYSPF